MIPDESMWSAVVIANTFLRRIAGREFGYDAAIFEQRGISTDSDAHDLPHDNPHRQDERKEQA